MRSPRQKAARRPAQARKALIIDLNAHAVTETQSAHVGGGCAASREQHAHGGVAIAVLALLLRRRMR